MSTLLDSLSRAAGLGKIPTTSVRRLTSRLSRSSGLVLQILHQCGIRRPGAGAPAVSNDTYQQIAAEVGYTSRGTVYKIIKVAQTAQLTNAVEEHLNTEVRRLNALQAVVWPAALAGRPPRHAGGCAGHRGPAAGC